MCWDGLDPVQLVAADSIPLSDEQADRQTDSHGDDDDSCHAPAIAGDNSNVR